MQFMVLNVISMSIVSIQKRDKFGLNLFLGAMKNNKIKINTHKDAIKTNLYSLYLLNRCFMTKSKPNFKSNFPNETTTVANNYTEYH